MNLVKHQLPVAWDCSIKSTKFKTSLDNDPFFDLLQNRKYRRKSVSNGLNRCLSAIKSAVNISMSGLPSS